MWVDVPLECTPPTPRVFPVPTTVLTAAALGSALNVLTQKSRMACVVPRTSSSTSPRSSVSRATPPARCAMTLRSAAALFATVAAAKTGDLS